MPAPPRKTRFAAFLAGTAAIAALAGCGSSGGDVTFQNATADALIADLSGVQAAATQGDCQTAQVRADQFLSDVNALPASIGADTKTALRDAALHLKELTVDPSQCSTGASGQTGPTTSSSTTTTPPSTTSSTTTTSTETSTTTSTEQKPPPGHGGGGKPGGGGSGGTAP